MESRDTLYEIYIHNQERHFVIGLTLGDLVFGFLM
jgi:hypothetical protein